MSKILAIDDQQDNLTTIEAVIKANMPNCKVLTSLSGKEGIKIAQEEQPDTILLDIIMPKMDGFEVCKQLKTNDLTRHIPIIMLTAAKIDTKDRVKSLNLGADAFISKPIDNIELCAQVNVMLRIKEAEDSLRKEKKELDDLIQEKTKKVQYQATILENVSDPIISMDMDYMIVSWNKSAEELYGYKEEEVIGKFITDILKIEYINQSKEEVYEELLSNGKFNDEVSHHKKDGTKLILSISVSFIKDSNGDNIGLVSVMHDITKLKKIEDISRKMNMAINNTKEVIFLTDEAGIITYANPEFTRMYGYSSDEVVGKVTPRILKSGEFSKEAHEQFWKLLISKKSIPAVTYTNKCKDGTIVNVEGSADSILNEKGEIIGFLGIQRDVTERKSTEEKLKNQAVFVEQNPAPVFSTNYEGKVLSSNIAANNLTVRLNVGKSAYLIFTRKNQSEIKKLVNRNQVQLEQRIGGSIYLFTIKNDITTKQIYFFGSNITKLKEISKDLILALEKATESDHLKSVFLSTISHELRTPLNAIIGFSELINKDMSLDEIIICNKTINSSGNHLLKIVEDLFAITLIEAGEVRIIKKPTRLRSVLNNVHKIIKADQITAKKQDIDIKQIIPPECMDMMIKTDSSKLQQILIYLLKNAVKFTQKGHIHYGFAFETKENTPTLRFYIEDTGIGIPEINHKLIFEIFRQIDDSFTKTYAGAGVGLTIAKKLTELLGGRIWLTSKVGEKGGTTFYFTIPYEKYEKENDN